jgi:phospholipase C
LTKFQLEIGGAGRIGLRILLMLAFVGGAPACSGMHAPSSESADAKGAQKINHVIVIYQENWSFDGLFGFFPGADGIGQAGEAVKQVMKSGKSYSRLPRPVNTYLKPPAIDPRFPKSLPVAPFNLALYVKPNEKTGDLVHRFFQEQYQINGGRMDKFVAWSDAAGLAMSYYNAADGPEGQLARRFTLADRFFHAAFGGSFLNHIWLICACTPQWPEAPKDERIELDDDGILKKDGAVTPDGYAVNTVFPMNRPHPARITDPGRLLPRQTVPTIGERLSDKGISWAWYSGGWDDAMAGNPDPSFQYHHQPFNYFDAYADDTPAKAEHLRDISDFTEALGNGKLPAVSFVKPLGLNNEHPGYTDLMQGQAYVKSLVDSVMASPYWKETVVIITYDENGGRWDHVAPPVIDRWGPGTRVPAIIVSPYARKGYIDHTPYDTTSILKFIETRWNLEPLGTRDANADNMLKAFDFAQAP